MRAQRAPLRPTFSPARLCHVVYAGFSGGQMETILAWDSTSHGGKMPEGYLHLTCEQRCQIYALLQSGHSQAHIARQIGVDPSTISRELVRNTGARGYRFKQAHEKASQRRKEASDKPRKMTPDLVELIEERMPIRLLPTPPTCRMLPGSGVKLCVGRCGDVARDAEQGLGI